MVLHEIFNNLDGMGLHGKDIFRLKQAESAKSIGIKPHSTMFSFWCWTDCYKVTELIQMVTVLVQS